MKKMTKILISLLLLISIVVSTSSCARIPWYFLSTLSNKKRYTGGFDGNIGFYHNTSIHWVETFEEMMIALEHLEAAGNKIPYLTIPNYDNDVVDAKYCIRLYVKDAERLKRGEKWYDRKGADVIEVIYFGFLHTVTIEELEYSYVNRYRSFRTYQDEECEIPEGSKFHYNCYMGNGKCSVRLYPGGPALFWVEYYHMDNHRELLPEDYEEAFLASIVIIN